MAAPLAERGGGVGCGGEELTRGFEELKALESEVSACCGAAFFFAFFFFGSA